MSKSKDVYAVTEKTMLGDLVKICVEELRAAPDVWQKLGESKQAEAIDRMHKRCTKVIRDAVRLFSSDGTRGVEVDVDRFTSDGGIKIVVSLSRNGDQAQAHAALALVGKPALLVIADAEQHLGGEVPKADPDQPGLFLSEEAAAANAKMADAIDAIADAIESGAPKKKAAAAPKKKAAAAPKKKRP